MIHEDRELLVELKEVTTHVTDFVIAILGATPVNPEAQRELAERLLTTGQLLLDHTNAGHIINGYVNGTTSTNAECSPDERLRPQVLDETAWPRAGSGSGVPLHELAESEDSR